MHGGGTAGNHGGGTVHGGGMHGGGTVHGGGMHGGGTAVHSEVCAVALAGNLLEGLAACAGTTGDADDE